MSPKKKNATFPTVRVTDKLLEETQKCADQADEYLSDYIRKAVEQRNAQRKPTLLEDFDKEVEIITSKTTTQDLKKMVKEMERPKQIQTFFKK